MDKRKMRVTQDHWSLIVEYAEHHPEIVTNKFSTHIQGKQNFKLLWEELTNKLNSLGQGTRNVEEWKKTLADWKSKTKKKASQNSKEFTQTGGGPANAPPLSKLEEKLISIMGQTAIFGDNTASERGIKRKNPEITKVSEITGEIFDGSEDIQLIDFQEDYGHADSFDAQNSTINVEVIKVNPCTSAGNQSETPRSTSASTRSIKDKKDLNEMHSDVLCVLKRIEGCLQNMDNSLKSIAISLENIAKLQQSK